MGWYEAPIALRSELVAVRLETAPEATANTSFSKRCTVSTFVQSGSVRQVTCCLTLADKNVDAHCVSCKATGTRYKKVAAPTRACGEH